MPRDPESRPQTAVADADEAARAQRRLRDLLRATTTVVERLDLEVVLRRIVEVGDDARRRPLRRARRDRRRRQRAGALHPRRRRRAQTVARIGHLPAGKGTARRRDRRARADPARAPDGRPALGGLSRAPPGDGFVPRCSGARRRSGLRQPLSRHRAHERRSTADDEELVVALAATAGIAIENARLYDISPGPRSRGARRRPTSWRRCWRPPATTSSKSSPSTSARSIDVDLVAVVVPHGDDELRITTARGAGAEAWRDRVFPRRARSPRARWQPVARRASTVSRRSSTASAPLGPTVAIPLFAGDEPLGASDRLASAARPGFTDVDVDMAFAFAGQAGVAIEVVRAREDRRRLELSRDRATDRPGSARPRHPAALRCRAVAAGDLGDRRRGDSGGDRDAGRRGGCRDQGHPHGRSSRSGRAIAPGAGCRATGCSMSCRRCRPACRSTPRITFAGPLDSLVSAPTRRRPDRGAARMPHERHEARARRRRSRSTVEHRRRRRHRDRRRRRTRHPPVGSAQRPGEPGRARALRGRHLHDRTARPAAAPASCGRCPRAPTTEGAIIVIRVFLVDDHEIVRRGIAQLIDAEADLTVVGEAGLALTRRNGASRRRFPTSPCWTCGFPTATGSTCAATSGRRTPTSHA